MKKNRFSMSCSGFKQAELGLPVADLARRTGISEQTFYWWNKQLEPDRLRARLLFLPEETLAALAADKENLPRRFVEAQVALALDILLAIPLHAQNLLSLHCVGISRNRTDQGAA